jgi:hypothetical protein
MTAYNNGLGNVSYRNPLYIESDRRMVEHKRFSQEFFSGCDCKIYFDDVLVDTVTALQFSLSEQVIPIYGYKSYTFDVVARGNRIIKGSFRIAFKEAYYLQAIMNQVEVKRDQAVVNSKPFDFQGSYLENTIESLLASAGNSARFEELADEYEKAMWGEGNEDFTKRSNDQTYTSFFYPKDRQSVINNYGFSIMITYGNIDRETIVNGKQETHVPSTTENIVGVQLMDVGKVIDPTGQPIFEEYSFIAKDINRGMVTTR